LSMDVLGCAYQGMPRAETRWGALSQSDGLSGRLGWAAARQPRAPTLV